MNWFTKNFKMDRTRAAQENEALFTPLKHNQRRSNFAMYCTAFSWGFLMTGLAAGAQLYGLAWKDAVLAVIIGNLVLVIVAGLCAIPGQQTGMGNSPVFKLVFGKYGFCIPAIILIVCVIGWQGSNIGMIVSTWTGGLTTGSLYVVIAIVVGTISLLMTYFGIGLIEKFAMVATVLLVIIGVISMYLCIKSHGSFAEFRAYVDANVDSSKTLFNAITQVIGAWIAGSIICTELTRFAKNRTVASTMMIIGLPLCQIFLNLMGYMGMASFGTYDFTAYIGQLGVVAYIVAMIAMTFALFGSIDVNLYFPSALFSTLTNMPRKGGVIICGTLGLLVAAFELFAHYGSFLNVLGAMLPALAGPIIAEYFIVAKGRWDPKLLHKMPNWNWAAIIGYAIGVLSQYIWYPPFLPKEVWSLLLAIIVTLILNIVFRAVNKPQGYTSCKHMEVEPILPGEDDANLGDFEANFINYDK